MRRSLIALSLVFLPILMPVPVSATSLPRTPAMVPMYCGSLCAPAAPVIVAEAAGGGAATLQVPTAVAAGGGYITKAGAGSSALGILGFGGLSGWKLGLGELLPWRTRSQNPDGIPASTGNPGTQTITIDGARSRTGQGPGSVTFTVTIPPYNPNGRLTSLTVQATATNLPGGLSWQFGVECIGYEGSFHPEGPTGLASVGSTQTGTRSCANPGIAAARVSVADMAGEGIYRTIDIGRWSPDWDPNPRRYVQTTVDCTDANGNTSSITKTGPETTGTKEWSMPAVACPKGSVVTGVEADLSVDGSLMRIGAATMPASLAEMFAECTPGIDAGCWLELTKPNGDPAGLSDLEPKPQRDNLGCRYNGRPVPVEWCTPIIYPPIPDPPRTIVPVEGTDPPGQPLPNPDLDPPPNPTPTPTGPDPDPTPTPTPTPSAPPIDPRTEGEENVGCMHWTLGNFLTGKVVYQAVGCALQWAFVPRPEVVSQLMSEFRTDVQDTAPYVAIAGGTARLQGFASAVNGMGGGGCAGPTLDFRGVTIDPVNLCSPPQSTWAGWIKLATSASLVIFGVMRIVGVLAAAFGISVPWSKGSSEGE